MTYSLHLYLTDCSGKLVSTLFTVDKELEAQRRNILHKTTGQGDVQTEKTPAVLNQGIVPYLLLHAASHCSLGKVQ